MASVSLDTNNYVSDQSFAMNKHINNDQQQHDQLVKTSNQLQDANINHANQWINHIEQVDVDHKQTEQSKQQSTIFLHRKDEFDNVKLAKSSCFESTNSSNNQLISVRQNDNYVNYSNCRQQQHNQEFEEFATNQSDIYPLSLATTSSLTNTLVMIIPKYLSNIIHATN